MLLFTSNIEHAEGSHGLSEDECLHILLLTCSVHVFLLKISQLERILVVRSFLGLLHYTCSEWQTGENLSGRFDFLLLAVGFRSSNVEWTDRCHVSPSNTHVLESRHLFILMLMPFD